MANQATSEAILTIKAIDQASKSLETIGTGFDKITAKARKQSDEVKKLTEQQKALRGAFKGIADGVTLVDGPLGNVASRFRTFGTLLKDIPPGIAITVAALAGLAKFSADGVGAFRQYEDQILRFDQAMAASGRNLGKFEGDLKALAESVEGSTLFSAEDALGASAIFASFDNIPTEKIETLVKLATDLSARFGGDLSKNALVLAKAFEQPGNAAETLKRKGLALDAQEIQLMKTWQEKGQILEAQNFLLEKYKTVQGSAAAANKGLSGSVDNLANSYEDLARNFAQTFGLTAATKNFNDSIGGALNRANGLINSMSLGLQRAWEDVGRLNARFMNALDLNHQKEDLAEVEKQIATIRARTDELVEGGLLWADALAQARKEYDGINKLQQEVQNSGPTEEQIAAANAIAKQTKSITQQTEAMKIQLTTREADARIAEIQVRLRDKSSELSEVERQNLEAQIPVLRENAAIRSRLDMSKQIQSNISGLQTELKALQKRETELKAIAAGGTKESGDVLVLQARYADAATEAEKRLLNVMIDKQHAIDGLNKQVERQKKLTDDVANAFGNVFDSIVDGGKDATQIVSELAKELAKALLQAALIAPLKEAFSGFGSGFSSFIPFFNAKGNAFDSGRVVPFAKGGVPGGGPHAFPMAGGKTGIFNESGQEGIFPLTRTSSGDLAVHAVGAGGGDFVYSPTMVFQDSGKGKGGGGGSDPRDNERLAKVIDNEVSRKVVEILQREGRIGGMLNPGSTIA